MALLHPDSDLSLSAVVYGSDVIRLLCTTSKTQGVDQLLERYLARDRRRTPQSFFSALDMLYTLGAIDVTGYRVHLTSYKERVSSTDGGTGDLFGDGNA